VSATSDNPSRAFERACQNMADAQAMSFAPPGEDPPHRDDETETTGPAGPDGGGD
jgi:hypothetical protein